MTFVLTICLIHYPDAFALFGIVHWLLDDDSSRILTVSLLAMSLLGSIYYSFCTFGTFLAIGQYKVWWIATSFIAMIPPLVLCVMSSVEIWLRVL